MAGLVMTIPGLGSGSNASDAGIGFVGVPEIPHSPMAFYLHGTRFGSGLFDLTGNGHHARKIGAPARGELYAAQTDNDNCFETPITGTQAVAFGGMTLVAISRTPDDLSGVAIGNFFDNDTVSASLGMPPDFLVRTYATVVSQRSGITLDAARGDRWTFSAGTFTSTATQVFERHYGAALQTGTADTFAEQTVGGDALIRLGGCHSTIAFLDTLDIIGGGIFQSVLTTDQLDDIYEYLSALMISQGELV